MKNSERPIIVNPKKASLFPLGVVIEANGINFAVSMPRMGEVKLLLYRKKRNEKLENQKMFVSLDSVLIKEEEDVIEITIPEENKRGKVACIYLEHIKPSQWDYNYSFEGKVVPDPYARRIVGMEVWGKRRNEIRGSFVTDHFLWEEDVKPNTPYEDSFIYRMHVRGFTKHTSSKVKQKGTFAGIIEKIPYLKSLGVTLVELLPSYEFDEIIQNTSNFRYDKESDDKSFLNYWGYTDGFYFAPKSAYAYVSSRKKRADAVYEFKTLIKELHKNGIELGMEFYFVPDTPITQIIDCLHYWVLEYHIDAIHLHADDISTTVIGKDEVLSSVKIFANFWNTDEIYGKKLPFYRKNLAEYNNGFMIDARRMLKADENQMDAFLYRIARNPDEMAVINYMANHDTLTLKDMVTYEQKHNEVNGEDNRDGNPFNFTWNCGVEGETRHKKILARRSQQLKNALIILFLSQGTPMLMAGDEMGKTQKGNNNPYCQDNEISWINWKLNKQSEEVYRFVKSLIAFRKKHRILHMPKQLRGLDPDMISCPDLSYHGTKAWYPQINTYSRAVGVMYGGFYAKYAQGEEDANIYVAYNIYWEEHKFALPHLPKGKVWKLAIHTACDHAPFVYEEEVALEDQRGILLPPRSIAVLIGQ